MLLTLIIRSNDMCEKNYKTERIQEVDERVCLLFYHPWSRIGNPGKSQRNLKKIMFFSDYKSKQKSINNTKYTR